MKSDVKIKGGLAYDTRMVRTRYAPSPTGPFHIGAARAALFGYAFAKNSGGAFVVRIEDTDLERSDKEYERDIFENLHWLGIVPDESPETGGSWAPYRQTGLSSGKIGRAHV